MRTIKTPDNTDVLVADIVVAYHDDQIPIDCTVVIDNELGFNLYDKLNDPEWEAWDQAFFYYLTEEEWEQLINGEPVSEEWRLVEEKVG